ncbi:hypothetical protein CO178_00070 [candidate division WWE3 bacterium CG_4_9_14_3_um_filter_34_6]|uniref:ComEC/Rec2-related protein domain-containing protein n=1 Tax=candidate division WWE3 bacterium CG_4_9_14_3_um_filter_34_6 TaxID=1975079 RepID=A0A2M7X5R9_UNCKA|nr:MAG: hypothetical protein CO178_00070 [candidate division WWE3 bacterium CG_4_9_14_3_um_filter_34_6]
MKSVIFANLFFLIILALCSSWRVYEMWNINLDDNLRRIEGIIFSHPYIKDGLQTIRLKDSIVKTEIFPSYKSGDYIVVEGKSKNSKVFYYPKINIVEDKSIKLMRFISDFRGAMVKRIQKNYPEPQAGLILGMTIGYKEDFPEKFVDLLRKTGTIHIIVVSGYNISLVLTFVSIIVSKLGKNVFFVASLIFVLLYLSLVGLDPPVIRASFMGIVNAFAILTGRYKLSMYVLLLSFMSLLIVNPEYIVDLGFQMSFIATFAVILVGNVTRKFGAFVSTIFVVTGVNLFLYPVLSNSFGYISIASIFVNLLIFWIVPFVTVLGFLSMIFGSFVVKIFLISLIDYYLVISEIFYKNEFASISMVFGPVLIIIYYLIIFLFLRILYLFNSDLDEN